MAAVSYTNTKPFIYGIEKSGMAEVMELSVEIPSTCAKKLISNQVDIGLIPVAVIPEIPSPFIITDYCIGSVGAVNSVFIFSDKPIDQVKTLRLDTHSRTSNLLARVLLKFYFKQDVQIIVDEDVSCDAFVLIGDRTFGKSDDFAYAYDLGAEWQKFTGLPFVYAAWVANKEIPQAFIIQFNEALALGLAERKELLKSLPEIPNFDLNDYLLHKLDFNLDDQKRKALQLFLTYIEKL